MKRPDPFILGILAALVIGLLWPAPEAFREVIDKLGDIMVAVLFLLYGMRLRTGEVMRGLTNVRVQGLIFTATYIIFPLLGLATYASLAGLLGEQFARGILYLSLLPSTVQSSVTFTSIARGDTAAAVCAATFSNVIGMFLTPAWVVLAMHEDSVGAGSMTQVLTHLLLPFIIGQLLQKNPGERLRRHPKAVRAVDQTTIIIIVLGAVMDATSVGVWSGVRLVELVSLLVVSGALLAIMLFVTWFSAKAVGCDRGGQIAVLMCGSKKSLATGLPMAQAMFPPAVLGAIAVPVIIFHQLQLLVCAYLAARLGRDEPRTLPLD
ncbi:MAG: bile acid:sodium symporter family protein [Flaviflexus sp.]|nr:bile acid:sodium symporter family protein [Flaviflexus sp.]